MKKAVFFDIDGTLWDFKMNIPESTKKALKELRKNGYYAFLCSGRSRSNIKSPKLLALGFDGIVAACGTHIEFEGEKLFELLLTKEQIGHILAVLRKHQIPMVLEGPNYIYVDEKDFVDDPYVIYLRNELGENLKSITGTAQYEVNKLSAELGNADVELVRKELGTEFDMIVHEPDGIRSAQKDRSRLTGHRSGGFPLHYAGGCAGPTPAAPHAGHPGGDPGQCVPLHPDHRPGRAGHVRL